jgi:hypothetical protein
VKSACCVIQEELCEHIVEAMNGTRIDQLSLFVHEFFLNAVDRKNKALVKKMTWVQQQRKDKKTTVPSTGIQSLHEGGQGVTIGHWFLSIFSC